MGHLVWRLAGDTASAQKEGGYLPNKATNSIFHTSDFLWSPKECCGEGNGTPLQYSCLENPLDGGAWWAAVHGVVDRHD